MWKQTLFTSFRDFTFIFLILFSADFDASRSVIGSFFAFFAKLCPKTCITALNPEFLFLFELFYLVTWVDLHLYYPSPCWGGGKEPPVVFANSSWNTGNFALKLAIPLRATIPHLVSTNKNQVIIGQPWVTSEWRHVSPILTSKMGLRESPPLVQF